jgi:O-antigen biosynthesis protein
VHAVARGLIPIAPNWLEELVALLARPGVGVVSGAVFCRGVLTQSALTTELNGQVQVLAAGNAWGKPGLFGAACLVRGCDAATTDVMLMRRELWPMWLQTQGTEVARAVAFGCAARTAGWRIVWTPFAAFDDAPKS